MRKITAFLFFIVLTFYCSSQEISSISTNTSESLFKIKKIKNKNSFYIIYAERNDSTFKIISHVSNSDNTSGYSQIQVGNIYKIHLTNRYSKYWILGRPVAPNLGVKKRNYLIKVGNKYKNVKLEKKSHETIYTAQNLNGLFLVEQQIP